MESLQVLVSKLEEKTKRVSKLKKDTQRELDQTKSILKRSSSGLASVQKKLDSLRGQLEDLTALLNQKTAQRESLERLITDAQQRLNKQKIIKKEAMQITPQADPRQLQHAQATIQTTSAKIKDLTDELRMRRQMAKKVAISISQIESQRLLLLSKIQKYTKKQRTLRDLYRSSKTSAEQLKESLQTKTRQETSARIRLKKIRKRLALRRNKRSSLRTKPRTRR